MRGSYFASILSLRCLAHASDELCLPRNELDLLTLYPNTIVPVFRLMILMLACSLVLVEPMKAILAQPARSDSVTPDSSKSALDLSVTSTSGTSLLCIAAAR